MLNPNKIQRYLYIFLYFINLSFCIIKVRNTDNHLIVGRFSDVESDFGGEFMDEETAYLIISNPILACNSTIVPPPFEPQNGSNIIFISLIKRGFCTFENKVRSAQMSGYHGVIVFNIDDYIFPMKKSDNSDENPVVIPSRMVTYSNGMQLMKFNYSSSNNQFVVIFFKDFEFNPQYYIIAFLGFVSLGFLLIGIGFAIKLCRDCVKRRANRLKKCHLKKIPIKKFVKGEDPYDICAICLEDFVNGEKLRILPCNHAYHLKCIDPWLLKQKRNCPICKNRIKIEGRDDDSDDNSAAAPSESSNVVIDEHTPLINLRNDGPTSFFTFNENENTFSPERTGTLAPNYYENLCIDDSVTATPVEQSKDLVAQTHSINGGDDVEIIIGDTATNKTVAHDHAEDLSKKV